MNDKAPDDLTKMLLESSFRESGNFWTRNGGFMTFHSIMLGLTANLMKSPGYDVHMIAGLSVLGFIVGLFHLFTIRVSRHYNKTWYDSLETWVEKRAKTSNEDGWKHLHQTLVRNEKELPRPGLHSTSIAQLIPYAVMSSWLSLAIYVLFL